MNQHEIDQWLAAFDANPADVMDSVPDKRDGSGDLRGEALTRFDDEAILSSDFVLQRDGVRASIYDEDAAGNAYTVADVAAGKAPIERRDRAQDLVDVLRYERPEDVSAASLDKADLAETPWSDDYWAIVNGVLGHRYADPAFPRSPDWKKNHDYVIKNPAAKIVAGGDQAAIDALSPSEKYDLCAGDAAWTLTEGMWAEGRRYHERGGRVEPWMGICHGWAPASYMLRRPQRMVTVRSPSGVTVRFFPSDIKALASLLWANAAPPTRFIGRRCAEKDPPKDEGGRVLSQAAFDNNPGTFYLALVNQIGVAQRALVMDATYDYEVWNQPVCGYEVHYFDPQQMRFAGSVRAATVARDDLTRDRFARYRGKDCKAVVGVAMRTRFVSETVPSHVEADGPAHDSTALVDYYFDLELDGAGRVTGGEWYLNRHPDFLWTPAPGRRAVTAADSFATGMWDTGLAMPPSWRAAAVRGSTNGQPLAKVVELLIALANG